jgi:hypothetical protein
MREFTKSMMSFSWAMTVFGTQQMLDIVRSQGRAENLHEVTEAFDNVTHAAEGEMGEMMKTMFNAGNSMQKNMLDMMMGMMSFGGMGQNGMGKMMANIGQQSADAMRQGMRVAQQAVGTVSQTVQSAASTAAKSSGWGPMPASGSSQPPPSPTSASAPSASSSASSSVGWGPMPTQSADPKAKK